MRNIENLLHQFHVATVEWCTRGNGESYSKVLAVKEALKAEFAAQAQISDKSERDLRAYVNVCSVAEKRLKDTECRLAEALKRLEFAKKAAAAWKESAKSSWRWWQDWKRQGLEEHLNVIKEREFERERADKLENRLHSVIGVIRSGRVRSKKSMWPKMRLGDRD